MKHSKHDEDKMMSDKEMMGGKKCYSCGEKGHADMKHMKEHTSGPTYKGVMMTWQGK